ncbi:hypothetical protein BCAR13_860035 [Paraburkholderia caribensis]|nr:hypothetical protein BCAR13_860035 [Paraburkholderia caribensis]
MDGRLVGQTSACQRPLQNISRIFRLCVMSEIDLESTLLLEFILHKRTYGFFHKDISRQTHYLLNGQFGGKGILKKCLPTNDMSTN